MLKTLARGTKGEVLATMNGWSYVRFSNGLVGWVRSDLLSSGTITPPPASDADKASLDKSFTRWDKHLKGSYLNFDNLSRRDPVSTTRKDCRSSD
ncbi:MAG TPA: hypothetical protein PKO06_24580, partial [Candidatus Ozemobacteraceae bacterium]|nr:hypothetical protein [Candidatus Ozemobacteraceae bacterium]